jgi:foldase protein PrsA
LRTYYREHIDDFSKPPMINVHEILLDNQQHALRIKGQLLSGSNFADLARQHSLRPWSAARGGEMGLSAISQFGSLADRLWDAPLNEIIGPIEIQGLWGTFKITEKIDAQPREYEEVIGAVARQYKKDHQASIVFNYLVGLNRKVDIQVNEELIRWFYFDDPIFN